VVVAARVHHVELAAVGDDPQVGVRPRGVGDARRHGRVPRVVGEQRAHQEDAGGGLVEGDDAAHDVAVGAGPADEMLVRERVRVLGPGGVERRVVPGGEVGVEVLLEAGRELEQEDGGAAVAGVQVSEQVGGEALRLGDEVGLADEQDAAAGEVVEERGAVERRGGERLGGAGPGLRRERCAGRAGARLERDADGEDRRERAEDQRRAARDAGCGSHGGPLSRGGYARGAGPARLG
jgi:hypothetical protein